MRLLEKANRRTYQILSFLSKVFALSKRGQLRREESCAEVQDNISAEGPVKMVGCQLDPSEDQKWTLSEVLHFCY